jgi:hypothetical protein
MNHVLARSIAKMAAVIPPGLLRSLSGIESAGQHFSYASQRPAWVSASIH